MLGASISKDEVKSLTVPRLYVITLCLLLYFSPVIDKTADLLRSTVVTKENLHLKKFKTDNNECVERK